MRHVPLKGSFKGDIDIDKDIDIHIWGSFQKGVIGLLKRGLG